jgi:serine/threonine protein kinase
MAEPVSQSGSALPDSQSGPGSSPDEASGVKDPSIPPPTPPLASLETELSPTAEMPASRTPEAARRPGSRAWPKIPGYEMLAELPRSGMGVVYKARQVGLDRVVAIKMIRDADLASPEQFARFRLEAQAVARLDHPNIVKVHDYGEHEGRPYFSMEYLEGGSLAQYLAGRPLPAALAARLVAVLARAAQHAHQQGIIHRDLKPANVLLDFRFSIDDSRLEDKEAGTEGSAIENRQSKIENPLGNPKIADFGLAKRLDQEHSGLTGTGAVVGTAAYMAPEQAAGRIGQIGPAADVYALGAILYELLTGRPPFRGETLLDTLDLVRFHPPRPPAELRADVPAALEAVCLKCLEKEPHRRYASAGDLAADLERFLAGKPVQAPARPAGPPPPAAAAGSGPRRRGLVALGLLGGAAALVGLGLWGWEARNSDGPRHDPAGGHSPANPPPANTGPFTPAALAVLRARCQSCHDGTETPGGFNATSPDLVDRQVRSTGQWLVEPGRPDESSLLKRLVETESPGNDPHEVVPEVWSELAAWVRDLPPLPRPPAGTEPGGQLGRNLDRLTGRIAQFLAGRKEDRVAIGAWTGPSYLRRGGGPLLATALGKRLQGLGLTVFHRAPVEVAGDFYVIGDSPERLDQLFLRVRLTDSTGELIAQYECRTPLSDEWAEAFSPDDGDEDDDLSVETRVKFADVAQGIQRLLRSRAQGAVRLAGFRPAAGQRQGSGEVLDRLLRRELARKQVPVRDDAELTLGGEFQLVHESKTRLAVRVSVRVTDALGGPVVGTEVILFDTALIANLFNLTEVTPKEP